MTNSIIREVKWYQNNLITSSPHLLITYSTHLNSFHSIHSISFNFLSHHFIPLASPFLTVNLIPYVCSNSISSIVSQYLFIYLRSNSVYTLYTHNMSHHIYTRKHTYIYMYMWIYIYIYICIYIHTHIHIHVHTYTCTYTNIIARTHLLVVCTTSSQSS